jgi:hypothetical protein
MNNNFLSIGLLLLCVVVTVVVILIIQRSKQQMSGAMKWKFRGVAVFAILLLISNIGMTAARFADTETSTNNAIQIKTGWYNLAWHYRKAITINHTQVASGVQTNFTVLINSADPLWKNTASGGHAGKLNGGDFVFTAADGVTKLNHEVEKYTSTTGELIAWVMIPMLSNTTDTVIYIYYGNAAAADQWNPSAAWDTNVKGVWHLKEDPSGTAPQINDSTINANNGTTSGTMTTSEQVPGKIDGSVSFDGTNDYVSISDSTSLSIGTAVTVSAWIKPNSVSGTHEIIAKWQPSILGLLAFNQEYQLYSTGTEIGVGASSGSATTSGANLQINTWYHIEMVWSGGNSVTVYKNGASLGSYTLSYPLLQGGGTAASLSLANYDSGNYFSGIIDEAHIAMTARSAGWIQTEYNNQNSPSTFITVAAAEE